MAFRPAMALVATHTGAMPFEHPGRSGGVPGLPAGDARADYSAVGTICRRRKTGDELLPTGRDTETTGRATFPTGGTPGMTGRATLPTGETPSNTGEESLPTGPTRRNTGAERCRTGNARVMRMQSAIDAAGLPAPLEMLPCFRRLLCVSGTSPVTWEVCIRRGKVSRDAGGLHLSREDVLGVLLRRI